MAVVLRSNTDLVYLPDHGFVGEEGALRILNHLQANTSRLDISHNLLGSGGVMTLVKGLSHVRQRYSSDTFRIWTLSEINMAVNTLGDDSLECILGWAKKDHGLRKLLLQGNDIKLTENLEGILHGLASSKIATLSLTNNPLDPKGLANFLQQLEYPDLTELHLSTCKLPPSVADTIATFLGSPSARRLEFLELNGNRLGVDGVRKIVDAVEQSHFGIIQVGLLANEEYPRSTNDDEETPETPREGYDAEQEAKQLRYLVHERLPNLLFRNRYVTRRIRRAALRTIGPARVLLHAQPPSDEETAARIMTEVSATSSNSLSGNTSRPFPILDLPPEVLNHVIRHCSQDPYAFTSKQYAVLRLQATDREELGRLVRLRKDRMKGIYTREEMEAKERELRDEWLRRGGWDKWETEKV